MNKKLIFLMCLIYNYRERYVINESSCKKTIILILILEKIKEKNKLKDTIENKKIDETVNMAETYLLENFKNTIKKDYHNIFDIIKEDGNLKQASNYCDDMEVKILEEKQPSLRDNNFEAVISKETESDNEYLLQDNSISQSFDTLYKNTEDNAHKKQENCNGDKHNLNNDTFKINKTNLQNIVLSYIKTRYNKCEKDFKKNITTTIRQLKRGRVIANSNEIDPEFQIKNILPLNDIMVKVPVKIASIDINEMFYGDVVFEKPIISILNINNEVFITEKNIVPSLDKNILKGNLFYEGYLKCQIEYLEDTSICGNHIYGDSKYYITFLPFEGTKEIELSCSIFDTSEWLVSDFIFDINKYDFNVETNLEDSIKINKYIKLYKKCNIILDFNCEGIIAQKKLIRF